MSSGFLVTVIKRTVSLPVRLVERFRGTSDSTRTRPPPRPRPPSPSLLPSPLTYLTSSYLIVSLALAFVLHRIHHLVPPARTHTQVDRTASNTTNSALVQVGFRLPAVLVLLRSLVRLVLANDDHDALLWSAFVSIAVSITLEHFVRTVSDDDPSAHPFNLLSLSFLLHVQSGTPGAHRQLYVYLALTLAELVSLQISYVTPYLRPGGQRRTTTTTTTTTKRYRFAITLFYSLVSQFLALRSYYLLYHSSDPNEGGGALIWFNKVPELAFEAIVVTSVAVRALALVVRRDSSSSDDDEPWWRMMPGTTVWWDASEDYAVVLIKYATAVLQHTRVSTLSYELAPVSVLPSSVAASLESIGFDLSDSDPSRRRDEGGVPQGLTVRLERNGDVVLIEELVQEEEQARGGLPLRRRTGPDTSEAVTYGFGVEVKHVDVEPLRSSRSRSRSSGGGGAAQWNGEWGTGFDNDDDAARVEYGAGYDEGSAGGGGGGEFGTGLVEGERRARVATFLGVVVRIAFYLAYVGVVAVRDAVRHVQRRVGWRSLAGTLDDTWTTTRRQRRQGEFATAADEDEEDSDDQDWTPESDDEDRSSSESDDDDDDGRGNVEEHTPLELISDLSDPTATATAAALDPTELAPYLVAHHLSPANSGTLTRRRYETLFPSTRRRRHDDDEPTASSVDVLDAAIRSHLLSGATMMKMTADEREQKRAEWRESRSMFCVVCTVEPRTVILWPCRCLALCESCRDALAARTTTTQTQTHTQGPATPGSGGSLCPTCRVGVAGFSRIFIP
ncbi:hypothetical protein JCM11491_004772 [Sporobolomyces phaffii]